ncbi:hypothetical protein SANTM175S_00743 [Streptomyces antimycoticus]
MTTPAPSSRTSTAPSTGSSRWVPLTSWRLRQVRILTELTDESTYLGVPPISRTEGPGTHWRVPLSAEHYLTDAFKLCGALAEADRAELGPVPQGRQTCYHCELPTDEPVIVDIQHGGSGAGRTIYACPRHTRTHQRDAVTEAAARRRARDRAGPDDGRRVDRRRGQGPARRRGVARRHRTRRGLPRLPDPRRRV